MALLSGLATTRSEDETWVVELRGFKVEPLCAPEAACLRKV